MRVTAQWKAGRGARESLSIGPALEPEKSETGATETAAGVKPETNSPAAPAAKTATSNT